MRGPIATAAAVLLCTGSAVGQTGDAASRESGIVPAPATSGAPGPASAVAPNSSPGVTPTAPASGGASNEIPIAKPVTPERAIEELANSDEKGRQPNNTNVAPTPEETPLNPSKSDSPYFDVTGAWGWKNHSYLLTVCALNLYINDDGFGAHVRMLAPGYLTYERRMHDNNGLVSLDRKQAFVLDIVDPRFRIYPTEALFVTMGINIGIAFYDSAVPTLDGLVGAGFVVGGWGLEAGLQSYRLPSDAAVVGGQEFLHTKYWGMLHVGLETNLPF